MSVATTAAAAGRPVAERAVRQVRLLAVALLLVAAAGYRPPTGQDSGGQTSGLGSGGLGLSGALPVGLAVTIAVVLLAGTMVAAPAAERRWPQHPALPAGLGTCADLLVVLSVVCVAGVPPRSLAVVLLMLPLLEAALWFGLAGLTGAWLAATTLLVGYVLATSDLRLVDDLTALMLALPVLLLVTIPVALLAEHLVAEVTRLHRARLEADDRTALLEHLSTITAELFPLELTAVAGALTTGAHQLGADAAAVLPERAQPDQSGLAAAGNPEALALLTGTYLPSVTDPLSTTRSSSWPERSSGSPAGDLTRDPAGRVLLAWPLPLPDGDRYVLRVVLHGPDDQVARRVEALDLLVAQGRAALANASLVQELARLKHTYQERATRDQLTGLVNRRGLLDRARVMPGQLGVLFCDLDGFKTINDTLGHAAGDELLRQVADRLQRAAGGRGVLGRLGGDEFVLVLPQADPAALTQLAGELERHVALPYTLQAGPARVGVSIGTAAAAPGQDDLDAVLDHADQIMYAVKRDRRAVPRQPPPPGVRAGSA